MRKSSPSWALIAHGGAKDIAPADEQLNRAGLTEAIEAGSRMLEQGASALDTVEAVVKLLEKNPAYNAGLYGSVLNEDGEIEMDASIMDGATLQIGAVAGLQHVEHPVMVARALLDDRAILLVGEGANKFARAQGHLSWGKPPIRPASSPGCDTVGCVARDQSGSLAVATSTGGLEGTRSGRVGDVPLPGCGFYADNRRGAVSASGEGEQIARVLLASEFLHLLKNHSPEHAAIKTIELLAQVNGEAGFIAITPEGEIVWSHNSAHFAVGWAQAGAAPKICLHKEEIHET